jgi:hypothetical protein
MFGERVEIAGQEREQRLEALREALDLVGDANVAMAADLDVLYGAKPPTVALENGTWDFEAERALADELRSVMDRLAGLVYRLEREHAAEHKPATLTAATRHAA